MERYSLLPPQASEEQSHILRQALKVLNRGGIVAYPTETFYALGVRYDNDPALERLSKIKERAGNKPFPLIVGDTSKLDTIVCQVDEIEKGLINRYWPGPLTILFSSKAHLSDAITGIGKTVAVRIPGESFALSLAREAGFPITATSANPSGMPPPTDPETVLRYFSADIDTLIDGGLTPGGLPSTIVAVVKGEIVVKRKGRIERF